jgi:hypothetical protein
VGGGAGRDDKRVVADLPTAREHYLMAGDIDIGHFAEAHFSVLLAFQQDAQRGGDVGRGESASGDLVEQRLEQVKVPPVDQGHLDRSPFQGAGCEEAAKASPDNDNAVLRIHTVSSLGAGAWDLRVFIGLSRRFRTVSMLTEDRLGTGMVSGLDPDLGRHARDVADSGVQVVTEHLTANAILLKCLLPDVGLKRIRGCGKANNVVLIYQRHARVL